MENQNMGFGKMFRKKEYNSGKILVLKLSFYDFFLVISSFILCMVSSWMSVGLDVALVC